MKLFNNIVEATFLRRINRFMVECELKGKIVRAHLPNPGRLMELLIPRRNVFLKEDNSLTRSTNYTLMGVERKNTPVMLHTGKCNHVIRYLIENGRIPFLNGAEILKTEFSSNNSRFDFLLKHKDKKIVLEVKSCTLFGEKIAMFPDAPTLRGTRHLRELAGLADRNIKSMVIFLVHSPYVNYFMPDYHTDISFARTFIRVKNKVSFHAISVEWKNSFELSDRVKELAIPYSLIERETVDRGSYLLILGLKKNKKIATGKLGEIYYPEGYYIYVGSQMKELQHRIERHLRKQKNKFWHIDYLREYADFVKALPVRSSLPLECHIANSMSGISDSAIVNFGSSDCHCESHLFYMKNNPLQDERFIDNLIYWRIDRLNQELPMHKMHKKIIK